MPGCLVRISGLLIAVLLCSPMAHASIGCAIAVAGCVGCGKGIEVLTMNVTEQFKALMPTILKTSSLRSFKAAAMWTTTTTP